MMMSRKTLFNLGLLLQLHNKRFIAYVLDVTRTDHFLDVISSPTGPVMLQDIAFVTKTLKLDNGEGFVPPAAFSRTLVYIT